MPSGAHWSRSPAAAARPRSRTCATRCSARNGAAVVATAGNYNNEIGVPLTLARLRDDTRFAVVEMGATRRGDVAHLCRLARPQISTVLNAMEAHLEGFGSVAMSLISRPRSSTPWTQTVSRSSISINPGRRSGASGLPPAGASGHLFPLAPRRRCHRRGDVRDQGIAGSAFELHIGGDSRALTLPLPGRTTLPMRWRRPRWPRRRACHRYHRGGSRALHPGAGSP
jgi:UDP-N-acetylmuramyl pentapeptide synthase